jgi:hypothetical protein
MVDALGACRNADMVKIDIEREEWAIPSGPRQSQLRAYPVVLEWHLLESPEPDAAASPQSPASGRLCAHARA